MKHCVRTGKPVSPETWGFFDKYGAVIEEMQKYAFENHETIEIQFRGQVRDQECGDRQTWLNRDYNAGGKEIIDGIVLFERGLVSATQYEWIERVKK